MTPRLRALDGLRGFALLGMLAWHAQLDWVRGGFARMTVFFVLSGYLAALSLGRIDGGPTTRLVAFWGRRARRLLPVTLLGVLVAVGVTAGWGSSAARRQVTGDALSVLTSWSNWRFIFERRSYGAMFESPSAFQHYWSLSVEEQCLLLLPFVMAGVAVACGSKPGPGDRDVRLAAGLAALAAVASAVPLFVTMSTDATYFGTHVRIGEFLAGAALAVGFDHRRSDARTPGAGRRWAVAGTAGLLTLIAVMLLVDREAEWVYRGGMGLMSIPTVGVIGAVLVGAKAVTRVLSMFPLVALGRAALSIYVLHWPIYQVVEVELAGRARTTIVAVELMASLVAGFVVHAAFERPLLPGAAGAAGRAWSRAPVAVPVTAVAVAACLVAASLVPQRAPQVDLEAASADRSVSQEMSVEDAVAVLSDGVSRGTEVPVIRDPARVGVALFGGSSALTWALGSDGWTQDPAWAQAVPGYSPLGCGLLDEGRRGERDPANRIPEGAVPAECTDRSLRWAATVKAYDIGVPVIVGSSADLTSWRLTPESELSAIGEPDVDRALLVAMVESVDAMTAAGAQQVVVTTPMSPDRDLPEAQIELRRGRGDRYRELLEALARERPVHIVDLAAWSDALSDDEFRRLLPDGMHLSIEGARRAWDDLLGPALDDLHARSLVTAG